MGLPKHLTTSIYSRRGLILLQLFIGAAFGIQVGHEKERSGRAPLTLIHAYFINKGLSVERRDCMEMQLAKLRDALAGINVDFRYDRWPAVELHKCGDVKACMNEVPECFPSKKAGRMTRSEATNQAVAVRGTIGNWCAHLQLLPEMMKRLNIDVDYFFIFEDDIILDIPKFTEALYDLLRTSKHHWELVAFDTFGAEAKFQSKLQLRTKPPPEDLTSGGLPLYAISHGWGYWGAHAWLVDALHANRFTQFFKGTITLPADWIPKVRRPLHLGMMAYQTGTISQRDLLVHPQLEGSCLSESQSDILGKETHLQETHHAFSIRRENRTSRMFLPAAVDKKAVIREVILLGMYNSGIDLLYKVFHDNFEIPANIELCKGYSGQNSCGQVWTHTNPNRLQENFLGLDQAMGIIVVRHPFSQIQSWQNTEYDPGCSNFSSASTCDFKKLATGIQKHREGMARVPRPLCDSQNPNGPCWTSDKGSNSDKLTQENFASMWNSYMEGYLQATKWFEKVIILRFEDLVENPSEAMQQIANGLDVMPPGRSKDQPLFLVKSQLRTRALQKLGTFDYDSAWSNKEQKMICDKLNHGLLYQYGYHGCQNFEDDMYNTVTYEVGS